MNTFKDGSEICPCLLMGLGSFVVLVGQSLYHILLQSTLSNKLLSRGHWCSHDLTWPQQKPCLMICVNGNSNLFLNQIPMATYNSTTGLDHIAFVTGNKSHLCLMSCFICIAKKLEEDVPQNMWASSLQWTVDQ